MNLAAPLVPLSRRERIIAGAIALVCAATRFLSVAPYVWDWDEALFVLGMRDYDVTSHHPHPPGFPVYLGMARLMRLVVSDDFRALQSVNVIASLLVFPAVFFFARELRLPFRTSAMAGALFAFFPNVWFFGGGAFSDVPSIVLVLFAVTLLLRGAYDRKAYWLGTFVLAIAMGIRPQNFLLGLFPGLYATRKRRPAEIAFALLIGVVVVGAAFAGAMVATGKYERFIGVVREHADYISRVDSWRSPVRPPLWRLFDRFFVKQYQAPALSVIASIFAIVSIAGSIRERNRSMLFNALTFVPFAVFAWLMLDRFSISRFSIGYQPMFALFVADGMARAGRKREWLPPAMAAVLIAAFAVYCIPVFGIVRNEIPPSIAAARAAADHVDPSRERLFVGHTMTTFMDLERPGFPYTRVIDDRAMPLSTDQPSWLLAEITETGEGGFVFKRERTNLWNIARRHYFEVKLQPLEVRPRYVSGWHDAEREGIYEWRWMARRAVTILPPGDGRTLLRLHARVHHPLIDQRPLVTVRLNGQVLDTFRTEGLNVERDYRVTAAPHRQDNVLELSVDRTVVAEDGREVSLRVEFLAWGPA